MTVYHESPTIRGKKQIYGESYHGKSPLTLSNFYNNQGLCILTSQCNYDLRRILFP